MGSHAEPAVARPESQAALGEAWQRTVDVLRSALAELRAALVRAWAVMREAAVRATRAAGELAAALGESERGTTWWQRASGERAAGRARRVVRVTH